MPGHLITINNNDEMEWYVGDSKIDALITTLDELGRRTSGGAPSETSWTLCDSDVAEQFRIRTVFSAGKWSPWQDMPHGLKGHSLWYQGGKDRMVEHRRRA